MNLSKLVKSSLVKGKLRIDTSSILITITDTNVNIWKSIYNTGILLNNCEAIITPNKKFTIGRRKFNGKIHYLEMKKQMLSHTGASHKKLRILSSIPMTKKTNISKDQKNILEDSSKFFIYDASIYSEAFKYMNEKFSESILMNNFFIELNSIYEKLKQVHPTKKIETLLILKNNEGVLSNILNLAISKVNKKEIQSLSLFDNFILGSDSNKTILPLFFKEKGKIQASRQNLNKLFTLLQKNENADQLKKENIIDVNKETESIQDTPVKNSKLTSIISDLSTKKLISDKSTNTDDEVSIEIDSKQLNTILKKHKINNPDITSNVKTALDAYVNKTGEKISRDKAEIIVLKAINYTLHGDNKLSEEYLADPNKLINKLNDINTYQVPLRYPKLENYVIDPNDIIDIKHTTGQHRQKFEFEDAIHENVNKLFDSLNTTSSHPVKINKIEHEIVDDNMNRFTEYTVTLQNLTGGNKKPYTVKLKTPAIVNDKYFKIRGKNYIISSQHFMKPLTKTDKKDVRLLTNYAIVRLQLENLKFNPSELEEIINYLKVKYPTIINDKKSDENKLEFKDNSIIFINGKDVYKDSENDIYLDSEDNKLKNKLNKDLSINKGKYEYLFEVIQNKISEINPDDKLGKSKKSIPYLQTYIMSIRLPLIFYLWSQKGLLVTLNDFGIDYELADKQKKGDIAIPTKNNQYLVIKPKTFRQKILVNGLLVHKVKTNIDDFDNKEEIFPFINQQYGSRSIYRLNLMTENEIDPVTKELLEFENLPTNLPALFSGPCIDKLLNEKADKLSDLNIYRTRMSEMILHIMYTQIKQSHNHYRSKIEFGDDTAKIVIDENYIFKNLFESGIMEFSTSVNPVQEIMLSSRIIKGGPGGISDDRSFKIEHRNIHESHEGIIGAESTKENSLVGLVTHHTLTPSIVNKYGSYGNKDISKLSGWNIAAADESLIPFQNEMDSDRLILAVTHAGQVTPINNADKPLVRTGAEFIIPQLTSKRFIAKAKKDGKIYKIDKNKTLHVKYNDGTNDIFDIIPRKSQTKRGSFILLELDTLKEGEKFKANQIIAFNKQFSSDGIYCAGKNTKVAMMNYLGHNHEDSYCITKKFAKETTTDILKEVSILIPPQTKVLNIEKEVNKKLVGGEVLAEFIYDNDLEDYINDFEIDSELEDEDGESMSLISKGQNSIKLIAPPGEIVDIKVFINNKKVTDRSVVNYHSQLVKDTKKTIGKLASVIEDKQKQKSAVDNIDVSFFKIGSHKSKQFEFVGANIVFSIKQYKELREADKLSNRYGAKGVISKILDNSPKGEFTGEIEGTISPIGIFSRKNVAMVKEIYIGKIFYNLNKQIKEMASDKGIKTDHISKKIIAIYELLCSENTINSIKSNIKNYKSTTKFRNDIKNNNFELFFIVEPFTNNTKFDDIHNAAKILNIPLDEKVYIPELDTWTSEKVPVGITYFQALEHYGDVYSSIRSGEKYQPLTGQPTKGKSKLGGQQLGNLDVYALLQYGTSDVIDELRTIRSDDHKNKRLMNNQILETGSYELPSKMGKGKTQDVFKTYMNAIGLKIQ